MITLIYHKHGRAVPDADAEKFVRNLADGTSIMVSTENVIYAARCLVKEEQFDVEFVFEGKVVEHNEDGRIADWPEGFCDYFDHWMGRLL
jgi:hypothetical protein